MVPTATIEPLLGTDNSIILTGQVAHPDDVDVVKNLVMTVLPPDVRPSIVNALRVTSAGPAVAVRPLLDGGKAVPEVSGLGGLRAQSDPVTAPTAFVNPRVEPGKVHWHPSFQAACAASLQKYSGKPVLLFQMLGKLDEQFC
jgi:hypothetical protein